MSEGPENVMQIKPVLTDTGAPETLEVGEGFFPVLILTYMQPPRKSFCSGLAYASFQMPWLDKHTTTVTDIEFEEYCLSTSSHGLHSFSFFLLRMPWTERLVGHSPLALNSRRLRTSLSCFTPRTFMRMSFSKHREYPVQLYCLAVPSSLDERAPSFKSWDTVQ